MKDFNESNELAESLNKFTAFFSVDSIRDRCLDKLIIFEEFLLLAVNKIS